MSLDCYRHMPDDTATTILVPRRESLRATVANIPAEAQWYAQPGQRRPLERDMGGVLSISRGLVLHVQAGNNSPWGWFSRDDVKASSHWWVSKLGTVEQYVPAGRIAWTQAAGNSAWHSVETEGQPNEYLTDPQIEALGALYRWGAEHWRWPLQLAETPSGTGLGWHGMGGTAWGSHPSCPGNLRLHQRAAILAHAQPPTAPPPPPEIDVLLTQEDVEAIAVAVWAVAPPAITPKIRQGNMWETAAQAYNKTGDLQTSAAKILGELAALRSGMAAMSPVAAHALAALDADPLGDLLERVGGLPLADAIRIAEAATARASYLIPAAPPEEPS